MNTNNIRNFCIIAHIDHENQPLAEVIRGNKTISEKEMKNQVLDSMDLEREREVLQSKVTQ